jgi:O-antigen biosynthesis protein WbqP
MPRALDVFVALVALIVTAPITLAVAVAVRMTSPGPVLYWSDRVGRGSRLFRMPKFRTMRVGTPVVATDRLQDPRRHLTPIGAFLRKLSLDELPQLWCVLVGDMSLVGPRPALFNQHELIEARRATGIDRLRPGITGWAQVNGRDEISDERKVQLDAEYLRRRSPAMDARILFLTVRRVVSADGVSH